MRDKDQDDQESGETPPKRLSVAERARRARQDAYAKAKERKKAYMATPEMKAKLATQREKARNFRLERSAKIKSAKKDAHKVAKKELAQDLANERAKKQAARDEELKEMVRPALTLIKGGSES